MNRCVGRRILFFAAGIQILLMSGCSLRYETVPVVTDSTPEFVFSDAKMRRYRDNLRSVELTAGTIEQYKDSPSSYAQDVAFVAFNDDGEPETEGSCDYLHADTDSEIYGLYGGINLFSRKNSTNVSAERLKWNAKSEQLIGSRASDTVRIEKDGTVITGSGFSASGVSGRFMFTGSVSGSIETE